MTDVERLKAKAAEIAESEGRKLLDRTPGSESLRSLARQDAGGATSPDPGARGPCVVYVEHNRADREGGTWRASP